jgi:hypothetical protein
MLDLTTRRNGEVSRAQRALARQADRTDAFGHIALHRELRAGNPYLHAKLALMGLEYDKGAITRRED